MEYYRKYLQGQLGNLLSRVTAPKIQARLLELGPQASEEGWIMIDKPQAHGEGAKLENMLQSLPG